MKTLVSIQSQLRAPKDQRNQFGKFNYRKAEDILAAVKPLLVQSGLLLTMDDEVVTIGDRVFLKATATITDGAKSVTTHGYAELDDHKGMSREQMTGAASSYARKYALCGLFCIDDSSNDPDVISKTPEWYNAVMCSRSRQELTAVWNHYKRYHNDPQFVAEVKNQSTKLQ